MRYWILPALLCLVACQPEPPPPSEIPVMQTATEAAVPPDSTSATLFEAVMDQAKQEAWHTLSLGRIMQEAGLFFSGTPYVAGLLDAPEEETLVVSLDGFDCVLLVETALALAQGIAQQDYTYHTFVQNLEAMRYRDGTMDGYCSRLHYFSDWIRDNERRGLVANITREVGGEPLEKTIDFMSNHRDSYRHLANDSLYQGILDVEAALADLTVYHIPQDRIRPVYDQLQAGDIIATSTDIEGLDVTHTGLVFAHPDGRKGFLHASTSGGVKVSPDLQSYIENNRVQIGIVVARPQSPGR